MTDDKKPREFWILDYTSKRTPGGNLVYEAYDYRLTSDSAVHVIEKSAYDKLKVALEKIAYGVLTRPDGKWGYECSEIAQAALKLHDL